jgi:hypothetical protein
MSTVQTLSVPEPQSGTKRTNVLCCTFCGEPSIGLCEKLHLDWIIVLPRELKPGDVWKGPLCDKLYFIKTTEMQEDGLSITTKQGRKYFIVHLELPLLVRRMVPCMWPRCEFHCGKCLMYESQEQRAEHLGIQEAREAERRRELERRKQERQERAIERRTVKIRTPHGEMSVTRKKKLRPGI